MILIDARKFGGNCGDIPGRRGIKAQGGDDAALAGAGRCGDTTATSREIAKPGHDALRPWRRRVQPCQIVRTTDDAFVLELVEDEIAVHRRAQSTEDAARQKSADADALSGMFARNPVRPIGFVLRREIAPDGEIAGSLHVHAPCVISLML